MSDISSNLESSTPEAGAELKSRRRSLRMFRRKRSLLSTINYRLDQMLRTRKVFRAGFVLLPLAGFLLVSHTNNVLGPDGSESDLVSSERHVLNDDRLTASDPETLVQPHLALELSDDSTVVESTHAPASFSMAQLANVWSVSDLQSPGLSFEGSQRSNGW